MQTPNSETSTNEESEGGNDSPAASDTPGDFLNEKLAGESKQNAIADPVDVEQRFDKSGQDQSSDRSSSGKLSEVVQHESGIKSGSILDVLTHQSSGAFFSIFNFAAIAVVLAALAGFFYKAVFLGKPITKLGLLPQLDAVLNPSLKDAVIPIGRDPSGYLIFFPNGHFCEQVWSKFVIPLWNPLVACGFPLLGDPQSFIHSPAHLLGLFASPAAYNFGLLLEIALGGIGMIVVARLMSLSYAASILVALAYSLSPRVLVQIDIGGNEEFFPWIVASFVWLAQKPSYLRAAIAGAASAFLVFAAHPETSFFAILTAGILGFCLVAQNGPVGSAGVSAAAVANPGSADVSAAAVANPGSADVPAAAVANPGSADVPALAVANPGSADVPALAVANPGSADVPA
ncbi:MAG: hypothetical protein K2X77_28395, partial [Candidatus Obscuribacterales bacterium]|nr:hypothetical protein [Candidatus Obscuribacterales bacterium]